MNVQTSLARPQIRDENRVHPPGLKLLRHGGHRLKRKIVHIEVVMLRSACPIRQAARRIRVDAAFSARSRRTQPHLRIISPNRGHVAPLSYARGGFISHHCSRKASVKMGGNHQHYVPQSLRTVRKGIGSRHDGVRSLTYAKVGGCMLGARLVSVKLPKQGR